MRIEKRDDLGVVVIGRNEGERLRICLESILRRVELVVYVDSGSTDGSTDTARSRGAVVVDLDISIPFTAARARNEGIRKIKEIRGDLEFVQVVDGDCEITAGWFDTAMEVMKRREDVAVVCGRRRERHPEASIYNRLLDMEWNARTGEVSACGGDSLIRLKAFDDVRGFDPSLIAGEEPEMCLRMRRRDWRIVRTADEMTIHDAAMKEFSQWWKRSVRCGFTYAEGSAMHGASLDRYYLKQILSVLFWGLLVPISALGGAWFTNGMSLVLIGGYPILWWRFRRWRTAMNDASGDASLFALFGVLGKFAELQGVFNYWLDRSLGRTSRLIEYKTVQQ